jgi:hypothetical protein
MGVGTADVVGTGAGTEEVTIGRGDVVDEDGTTTAAFAGVTTAAGVGVGTGAVSNCVEVEIAFPFSSSMTTTTAGSSVA